MGFGGEAIPLPRKSDIDRSSVVIAIAVGLGSSEDGRLGGGSGVRSNWLGATGASCNVTLESGAREWIYTRASYKLILEDLPGAECEYAERVWL